MANKAQPGARAAESAARGEPAAPRPGTAAQRKVAEFLARVAATRHLAPRAPVEALEIERSSIVVRLRSHVDRELPHDVLRDQRELLTGLGLIPPEYDYEAGVFRLLGSQVAGFYEYRDKKMYLATDLDGPATDQTLSHELVHALQDQHYDLGARMGYQPEHGDLESAAQALAEGDATSAMLDVAAMETHQLAFESPDDLWAATFQSSMYDHSLDDVPKALRSSLLAPYIDGILFVHGLRRREAARPGGDASGWAGVDAAWRSPPETTEQLLHLDKYDAHEVGERIGSIAPPPGGGWASTFEDVMGEQGLRVAAEQWLPRRIAADVASGWGGDRVTVFRRAEGRGSKVETGAGVPGTEVAVAWHIRFDVSRKGGADGEAREAFKAFAEGLRTRAGVATNTLCVERGALGALAVVRSKRDLAIAAGPYERTETGVRNGADCAQSTRWAVDILASKKR